MFLSWLTLLVPSLSSITPILPEISLILLFIFELKRFVTSSIFEQKLEYHWNERRYSKKENAIVLLFGRLSNKHKLFLLHRNFKRTLFLVPRVSDCITLCLHHTFSLSQQCFEMCTSDTVYLRCFPHLSGACLLNELNKDAPKRYEKHR